MGVVFGYITKLLQGIHFSTLSQFRSTDYSNRGVGIMDKVLSLMTTHTGDRSQYNRSVAEIDDQLTNNEEIRGT